MIDAALNLLFRCSHRHLTRPFTPLSHEGVPSGETYMVCLDCTKQFAYDLKTMRIGEVIDHTHDACVIPHRAVKPRKRTLAYVLGAVLPVALLVRVGFKKAR